MAPRGRQINPGSSAYSSGGGYGLFCPTAAVGFCDITLAEGTSGVHQRVQAGRSEGTAVRRNAVISSGKQVR